jgi:hypothetical protein
MSIDTVARFDTAAVERVRAAEGSMYDAEVALHAAHQSHVGAWITAAGDRLHEAIVEHTAAVETAGRVLTVPREGKHATPLLSNGSASACMPSRIG